ncbi:alpha-amylase family glycosyl hydrolase [Lutimonas zeaxanthinifaciens]|uniref:alpha-amylase family glycosyl hydrolase n=1 Tax=Lutimonas zeaxanthinifaciens TaxID=3060215 RepID=UPI00265CF117|nr:alpha-amylase family glycosyl hydrolase [Lutimonas sp. YSD2104]WKK66222.1 alpha-amylase family glycosyl hydrolase [Lutimonas sp. YSD2104]
MKKFLLLFLLLCSLANAQQQNVTFEVVPESFSEEDLITITASDFSPAVWGVTDVYLWAWASANGIQEDSPTNGEWTNSNEAQKMTSNGDGTYSISFVPKDFYQRTGLETIGFLVKAKNGTGDKKSQDNVVAVGTVEVPPVTEAPVPNGMLDGINLDPNDNTKATLVLYAPLKAFVYLLGDFNNWQKDENYLLKKDSAKNRFWIELTGLTPQFDHMFQYLVDGTIRIADPYSTTILDDFNDQFIDEITYPNLPEYPSESTSHAVTLLRTGDEEFNWQNNDYKLPEKTDLVIYELLIRDFDNLHSFDAVKARLDYLQELGVNAIELMPVSEFDGNESWGYNPSFHMALDKYYGTPKAFKQLIDECHKRNMAVILDVVYNHATGQNPYYRMWNTSAGGYGGQASADSPFFNPVATHSYSVFNDFNHSKQATKDYVKRTVEYWIEEYRIDGFRWDLTKGFTQNCTASNESCTNALQADRVAVLKEYADYQWAVAPDFYVIFEHLGTNPEETQWVNYRLNEGKGIMMWSKLTDPYNESTLGYHENGKSDFSWIDYKKRNWSVPANVAYMESHDEERLMYKNLEFGNSSGGYNVKELSTALEREKIAGAFYFTVPGPRMIWQFGELGYDYSINTCENGTINSDCRVSNKPIRWDYADDPERKAVYDVWAKLIKLRLQEEIFTTENFILDVAKATGLKKIQLTDDDAGATLKYVNIIGNFGVTMQNINPEFQETGIWYDLMDDNSEYNVSNVNQLISLQPGEFRIYGSSQVVLPVMEFDPLADLTIYPNPTKNTFRINKNVQKVEIYDHTGRLVSNFKGDFYPDQEYDASFLEPSIYFLRISSEEGSSSRRLIIE